MDFWNYTKFIAKDFWNHAKYMIDHNYSHISYFLREFKYFSRCVGGATVMNSESEIDDPSSILVLICYVYYALIPL